METFFETNCLKSQADKEGGHLAKVQVHYASYRAWHAILPFTIPTKDIIQKLLNGTFLYLIHLPEEPL